MIKKRRPTDINKKIGRFAREADKYYAGSGYSPSERAESEERSLRKGASDAKRGKGTTGVGQATQWTRELARTRKDMRETSAREALARRDSRLTRKTRPKKR